MFYLDTLPSYIRSIIFSSEFNVVMEELKVVLNFSSDQRGALEYILTDLFEKKIKPEDLALVFRSQLGVTAEQADMLERSFFINIILPFTDFFGNHIEYFQKKYGDPEKALEESKVMPLLLKAINDALREKVAEIDALDNNREKEAIDMAALFEKNLVCHFYAPDGPYKVSLNNTIIFLISNVEGFVDMLLKALYANAERIGKEPIRLGDKDDQAPTVSNWIQDFLGFSGGIPSSIKMAQYMTDSPNAKKLPEKDKDALRRLLETFSVLKNFPESFQKISPEHWMVIPYHFPELETKTARELPEVPGSLPGVELTAIPPMQALAQKEFQAPLQPPAPVDYDRVIARITEVVALKLSDDISARVKPILSSRVRNIRNSIDTGERLKAPLADGGAGLAGEDADKLLKEANNAAQAVATGKADEYAPVKATGSLPEFTPDSDRGVEMTSVETGSPNKSGMTAVSDGIAAVAALPRNDVSVPAMTIKEVNGVPTLVEKKNGNGKKKETPAATGSLPAVEMTSTDSRIASVAALPRNDIPAALPIVATSDKVTASPQPAQQTVVPEPQPIVAPKTEANVVKSLPVVELTAIDTGSRIKSGMTVVPDGIAAVAPPPLSPSAVPAHLADAKPIPVTVRAVPASGAAKQKVADVKAPPRLVGVVDEIRALTIKDFRRLSQDPKEAVKRIYQKIQALEKESPTKKAEAIKAWKESDVYGLYLEIGQINLGVDMNKLVEERKAVGKEYLTSEEFDALLDLSEKLRF